MEAQNAINIISSRKLVAQAGSYELKVTSVTPHEGKFIVNLAAMTQYHIDEAKKFCKEGDFQSAVNQSISASIRPSDYIPSKGEIVKVYIDNVTTSNGITGLFVTSLSEVKAKAATKVAFSFDEMETPANTQSLATNQKEAAKVAA